LINDEGLVAASLSQQEGESSTAATLNKDEGLVAASLSQKEGERSTGATLNKDDSSVAASVSEQEEDSSAASAIQQGGEGTPASVVPAETEAPSTGPSNGIPPGQQEGDSKHPIEVVAPSLLNHHDESTAPSSEQQQQQGQPVAPLSNVEAAETGSAKDQQQADGKGSPPSQQAGDVSMMENLPPDANNATTDDFAFLDFGLKEVKELLPGVLMDISGLDNDQLNPAAFNPAIIVPEAPKLINREESRLNLVGHIEHLQSLLDDRLNVVETLLAQEEAEMRLWETGAAAAGSSTSGGSSTSATAAGSSTSATAAGSSTSSTAGSSTLSTASGSSTSSTASGSNTSALDMTAIKTGLGRLLQDLSSMKKANLLLSDRI